VRGTSRELLNNLVEGNFGAAQLVFWPVFNWNELEGGLSITHKHTTSCPGTFRKYNALLIIHFL